MRQGYPYFPEQFQVTDSNLATTLGPTDGSQTELSTLALEFHTTVPTRMKANPHLTDYRSDSTVKDKKCRLG